MVKYVGMDRMLLTVTMLLICLGLLMVYSSTMILAKEKFDDSFYFFKRHLLWLFFSLLAFFVVIFYKAPLYLNPRIIAAILGFSYLGLILVFFFPKINDSCRWLRFAGVSLQPSEFAKIAVVMYLAFILSRNRQDISHLRKLCVWLLPILLIEVLILKEPDFGNFMLILLLTAMILFVGGVPIRFFVMGLVLLAPVLALLIATNPERLSRVLSFLNPEKYAQGDGFQVLQSVYAIGSGGIFGQGIGNSVQKLFFLPYAYADFIFAIVAEELGLLGVMLVVGLFVVYFLRGVLIAKHSDSPHIYLLVSGFMLLVVTQAVLNISINIGLFPTKGIPLPFISSGGSSLFCNMLATAIILNVSRHRKGLFLHD